MQIEVSTITSKGQTTIPVLIRKELGISAGDEIIFEKKNDEIVVRKARPIDISYLKAIQANFASEWDSDEDNEAFNDL
jgi:AbrB family looped-hinge helix DNA binding protein